MMRLLCKIPWIALFTVILPAFAAPAAAQVVNDEWTRTYQLSSEDAASPSEAAMVADQYGQLHAFWREPNSRYGDTSIMYAVFNGEFWSEAVDIVVAPAGLTINALDVTIDQEDVLHLLWNESSNGPALYSFAPAASALSARAWEVPAPIPGIESYQLGLEVDSAGKLHVVYSTFFGLEPGAYYLSSEDKGQTWSSRVWLDPAIAPSEAPLKIEFDMDDQGGLHVLWDDTTIGTAATLGTQIKYVHSLDGGETWSSPFIIDEADETEDELRLPSPGLVVVGETVHVVWAGTSTTNREHRYSTDRGLTWSETASLFGGFHGQAIGDGLAVDANNQVHFLGQIRWPQGVWHATWEGDSWGPMELVYLIAEGGEADLHGRYHSHRVRAAILSGNQLVLTFTDGIDGPLYAMHRTLNSVSPDDPIPFPTATPIPTVASVPPTPTAPAATAVPVTFDATTAERTNTNQGTSVWLGVVPAALFLILVVVAQWVLKRS